jgi:CBS domain-containing protein
VPGPGGAAGPAGAPGDVAGFLGAHPPFDGLAPDELARVVAVTETEVSARGQTIFSPGTGPVASLWVVRTGSVEIIHDGRILDLLGPGEPFGHASMISGLPTGFEARAGEDTVCYRIPADVMRPLLARPDVLRFVARSIARSIAALPRVSEPAVDPVEVRAATLIRTAPLLCRGDEPIREAAKRMAAEDASAILVRTGRDRLGIVTDSDLRSRVVAAGLSPDAPVSAIMTEPAYTVRADRLGGEILLDMLERDVHHIPVLSPAGEILGVIDDGDLMAAHARQPFLLRRAIDLAGSPAELAAVATSLTPMIIALHDARAGAGQVTAVRSVVLDALTRRLVELAVRDAGVPPAPFAWFALGSLARREVVPSSDVDSAVAWQRDEPGVREYVARVARVVDEGLRACGIQPDAHGVSAASPPFARSLASWHASARSLSQDPTQEQALILVSMITDSRPVWSSGPAGAPGGGAPGGSAPGGGAPGVSWADGGLWEARDQPDPALLRLLARFALSFRPPTGFLRNFVVEHSGERRGQLDIKHGGLIPIVDLARWAAMAAGSTNGSGGSSGSGSTSGSGGSSASTLERLRVAEAAGTLEGSQAQTLTEAFEFIFSLRLDHQVEQLRRGEVPDDFIDPKTLNPLARSYLREAFRAVAAVQSGLANELSLGIR